MDYRLVTVAGTLWLLASPAYSACPSADAVAAYVAAWSEGKPAKTFGPGLSVQDGLCAQKQLVEQLKPKLGRAVGYKAAATNKRVQELLKIDAPTRGVLLERMLLKDGAEVPTSNLFVFESDMLLQVKDEGINDATEPVAMLNHLSAVIPFIELPSATTHLARGRCSTAPT